MLPREKTLKNILLAIFALLASCASTYSFICVRYETYQVLEYKFQHVLYSSWFSHRPDHYAPRKITRTGFRSRRIPGCCEPRYYFASANQCPTNSHCSEDNVCVCDEGYLKTSDSSCVLNAAITEDAIATTTPTEISTSTSTSQPCDGYCVENEKCLDDVCVCADGYQRVYKDYLPFCEPKCEPECINANCSAPNICHCLSLYERKDDGSCECTDMSCAYGKCNENGTCECEFGYVFDGNACIWANNTEISEPNNCNCWSEYGWQSDLSQPYAQMCFQLCDENTLIEDDSRCLPYKECKFFTGFLKCNDKIYKCLDVMKPTAVETSTTSQLAKQLAEKKDPTVMIAVLVVAFLAVILLVGLYLRRRQNMASRVGNYNQMEGEHQEE